MTAEELHAFVAESNRIEGITRKPTQAELDATQAFLALDKITVADVERLVFFYEPGAILRREPHLNVRVGSHIAPQGGPLIEARLKTFLDGINDADPWRAHAFYEDLHPFTDGNGRSGRAIWAWQMIRWQGGLPLGFLHQFYYQTLEHSNDR